MVGYAMQPHIGAVGTKLLYPDNTVQHAGIILGIGGIAQHCFIDNPREDVGFYGRLSVPFNYSAVTAACLMVSKEKYLEVNGLEEDKTYILSETVSPEEYVKSTNITKLPSSQTYTVTASKYNGSTIQEITVKAN